MRRTGEKMKVARACRLSAALLLYFLASTLCEPAEEPRETPALKFPAAYPATVLQQQLSSGNDQCGAINTSPIGRHALNEIDSDIRRRMVSDIGPAISRLYSDRKCALGHCQENPVFSCAEMKEIDEGSESRFYWVRLSNGSSVRVFCNFDRKCNCSELESNNGIEAWTRVAFFNMSDPTHDCPFNFWPIDQNEVRQMRLCHARYKGCTSVFFSTLGFNYRRVCGRVVGFQFGEPNAFRPFYKRPKRSLEDQYVDGISLTHGQAPRTHVWTFAMAEDETHFDDEACPCTISDETFSGVVPSFIGNDYFCDTGSRDRYRNIYYLDDPLWDGAGCGERSTCCEWRNPPWFCKLLPESTQNDLEFRVCRDSSIDDELLLLQLIELYIQ